MALATDEAAIEMRVLNGSKGPVVRSLRAQVDKAVYSRHMQCALEKAGVRILQGMATDIIVTGGRAEGIALSDGSRLSGRAVILCTGVYLESRTIIGDIIQESGPLGEPNSKGLSRSLMALGFKIGRFKTGTSPRIAKDSVDWAELTRERGAAEPLAFSFISTPRVWDTGACYSTYTCEATHEIIRRNRHRAPLFNGTIEGTGPRYCPSIEDKVIRFPERARHQIYLELESADSPEVYVLGLSTSLPLDVQVEMVRSLPGLRNAVITRPGYAIEYDYLSPSQLKPTLETSTVAGLFSAGQINGTSGYEEAAAQGLIAGINAAAYLAGTEPVILDRDQAYIGVLIDDLVGTTVEEPYRMLTSRAEYRLLLRQTNADMRLTPLGRRIGLVSDDRWRIFNRRRDLIESGKAALDRTVDGERPREALRDPHRNIDEFVERVPVLRELPPDVLKEVEIEAKYAGFIERQRREAERLKRYAGKRIPTNLDPSLVPGLSSEARHKLARYSPATIGKALAAGISPADALILLAHIKEAR